MALMLREAVYVLTSRTLITNGVELHLVEAGPTDGPLVLLLHGFPDFWWGWRHQIEFLAEQGFRVVVPDQRGYNTSDKPPGVRAYDIDTLAADIAGLADALEVPEFSVVGHDWGGLVAWWVAARYPARVKRLAILNAPHPDVFRRYVRRHPRQILKSLYVGFFQLPYLPEVMLKAKRFAMLRRSLTESSRPGTFTAEDLKKYVEVWSQPGALTAMLNYYRALMRRPWQRPAQISPPTLIIWGKQDDFLEAGLVKASLRWCKAGRAEFVKSAGHWVQSEAREQVNETLKRWLHEK